MSNQNTLYLMDTTTAPDNTKPNANSDKLLLVKKPHSKVIFIDSDESLAHATNIIANLSGAIAVDTERANGIKYDPEKAYLLQFKRQDTIFIVDPLKISDLSDFYTVLKNCEWILHSASQDIPCLSKIGMAPKTIFDTEKAARILGYKSPSLKNLLKLKLKISLEKLHSNENWSRRPLPDYWIDYACLDVEFLIELRDILYVELKNKRRLKYAEEEFKFCIKDTYPKYLAKVEQTSDPQYPQIFYSSKAYIRTRLELTMATHLYQMRQRYAQKNDIAVHRILSNNSLEKIVELKPKSYEELASYDFIKNHNHKNLKRIWQTIVNVYKLDKHQLLEFIVTPADTNAKLDSDAHYKFQLIQLSCQELAKNLGIDTDVLITTKTMRLLAKNIDFNASYYEIDKALKMTNLRNWQKDLVRKNIFEVFQG